MRASNTNHDEVGQLYRRHVPEVAAGVVDVVAVAREPGQYTMVAVHSHDPSINPVSACIGAGAAITKTILRELGGGIFVLSWSESVPEFIAHAMLPRGRGRSRTPKVTLDEVAHQAIVRVETGTMEHMMSRDALLLRLASRLVGWDIKLLPYD